MHSHLRHLPHVILLAGLCLPAHAAYVDCSPPPQQEDCSPQRLKKIGEEIRDAWIRNDTVTSSALWRHTMACQVLAHRTNQSRRPQHAR